MTLSMHHCGRVCGVNDATGELRTWWPRKEISIMGLCRVVSLETLSIRSVLWCKVVTCVLYLWYGYVMREIRPPPLTLTLTLTPNKVLSGHLHNIT